MTRTLYRSRSERMVLGVCGGLADYFGIDPTVVRLLAVLAAWLTGGAAIVAYIITGIVVPEEPIGAEASPAPDSGPDAQARAAAAGGKETAMTDDNVVPGTSAPEEPAPPPAAPLPPPQYVPPAQQPPQPPRQDRGRGGVVAGVILIVLGILFFAQEFIPGVNIGQFWPLILIVIGVSIILRRR